jgi:hypothetical protein
MADHLNDEALLAHSAMLDVLDLFAMRNTVDYMPEWGCRCAPIISSQAARFS